MSDQLKFGIIGASMEVITAAYESMRADRWTHVGAE
jgi:hypothetical protein